MVWVVSCGQDSSSDCETEGTDDNDGGTDDSDTDVGPATDVSVAIHDTVQTILVVTWDQEYATDEAWLRFTFENDEWYESPPKSGEAGAHEELILGVPQNTKVTFHVVTKSGDEEVESPAYEATTGDLPSTFPYKTINIYRPDLASPNRWMLGVADGGGYYHGPFFVFIMDRQGRIVWYHADIADNPIIGFPRVSKDGRYIFFSNRTPWSENEGFEPSVVKMTLDSKFFERVHLPLSDNADMTADGSILFNTGIFDYSDSWLMESLPNGTLREVWSCSAVFGDDCYSNTVNWNPLDDTVLLSYPYPNTVVEIDRATGELVAMYGEEPGSYTFDPDIWGFDFQHFPNITPEGTLMVSTHIPDFGKHAFMEFEIDRDNEVLMEKWTYREGDEWADAMGEAHRVPTGDGNILANYGSAGIIKEITPDKEIAWKVTFFGLDEHGTMEVMVGHCTLLDDLYALLQGPENQ
jgi:hypothetical protein